jgi:Uma2 family endonuclease
MKLARRVGPHTFDDFCFLIDKGQKADLLDGAIYLDPPESPDANQLFFWLLGLVDNFVDLKELGRVFGSRVAFRIDDLNGLEPDIAFIMKRRLHLVRANYVDGAPDWALEIVAAESADRDYHKKRIIYQEADVSEYWIVDEYLKKVIQLRLDDQGKYRAVRSRQGKLHSRVLPGFWIRPDWLWQEPRPKNVDVLSQVLS